MLTIEKRIDVLLNQLCLDEKLAQLGSCLIYELQTEGELDPQKMAGHLKDGIGQVSRLAGSSRYSPIQAARAANRIQRYLVEETRAGIPALVHEECCSGLMSLGATSFPQMIGLASTFHPELASAMSGEIRRQMRAIGAGQGLAPVLDVARDPRWGRVEETFGEDPLLVSQFGAAYVRGLQGEDLTQGVLATGKHFIGHSLSLGGLNCAPAALGPNDLYNVYLAPFQAAIREAGLATMMNAYPELDGEVVAASRRILTDLLRDRLGFEGLIVSDYVAVEMIHSYHAVAADRGSAARMALDAGIEVELPTLVCYGAPLKAALEAGEIGLEAVDAAVRRHLKAKLELGLFDHPYVDEGRVLEIFDTPEQRALARQIARESIVLLKNDGMLPLGKKVETLAVIGVNAADRRSQLGDYSYPAAYELLSQQPPAGSTFGRGDGTALAEHAVKGVTLLDGLLELLPSAVRLLYAPGWGEDGKEGGAEAALSIAGQADAVLLVLGERSGLVPQCTTGETRDSADLNLPPEQIALARRVLACGKPVAAVLINGRPLALPWLAEQADALLEAWLPGEEGGMALAEVVLGRANPGGKLPISIPRHVGQLPLFYNHKPSGLKSNWYVDYVSESTAPLFPFGHGLSYTSFAYHDLCIAQNELHPGEVNEISLVVENSGQIAGDEVVQLYLRQKFTSLPRPVQELKGFVRLNLQPGEQRRVRFRLPAELLAFYNRDLQLVLEAGLVEVMIGSSSTDIRLTGSFQLESSQPTAVAQRLFGAGVSVD
jgi:beta-glucosidase